jgi:subtilase family serine protease
MDQLCPHRMVADVSAVADPNTGLAVYDTFGYGGWLVVGGTSASAPVIAGVYALASERAEQPASGLYQNPGHLFDVTAGANGSNCSATYLCVAGPGYDGPTGLGTPNGTGSF